MPADIFVLIKVLTKILWWWNCACRCRSFTPMPTISLNIICYFSSMNHYVSECAIGCMLWNNSLLNWSDLNVNRKVSCFGCFFRRASATADEQSSIYFRVYTRRFIIDFVFVTVHALAELALMGWRFIIALLLFCCPKTCRSEYFALPTNNIVEPSLIMHFRPVLTTPTQSIFFRVLFASLSSGWATTMSRLLGHNGK